MDSQCGCTNLFPRPLPALFFPLSFSFCQGDASASLLFLRLVGHFSCNEFFFSESRWQFGLVLLKLRGQPAPSLRSSLVIRLLKVLYCFLSPLAMPVQLPPFDFTNGPPFFFFGNSFLFAPFPSYQSLWRRRASLAALLPLPPPSHPPPSRTFLIPPLPNPHSHRNALFPK